MPVSKFSSDRLEELWESAFPLNSAWVEFAKPFDSSVHGALPARPEQVVVTTRNKRIHLLGEVYAGHLWAIGFQRFPDGSADLVRVPRQLFFFEGGVSGAAIHWDRGELTIGTTIYFDIRVTPPWRSPSPRSKFPRTKSRANNPPKTKRAKTRGRPNTSNAILRKTQELYRTRPQFRTLSRKEMVGEVRAALLGDDQRDAEIRDFKSSSMQKTIGRAIRSIRNQNKRNKRNKF